ncbi:MAG: hypothetical protein Q4A05_04800 [Ruminococcus sp.]|nr:hypothetical protein [Ruminococcus sp.]
MYEVSAEFRQLLESGAAQRIRGVVSDVGGGEYYRLSADNISKPQFTRQCTTSPDCFGVGQLYTSTMSVKILGVPELARTDLRGGRIVLAFSVEGAGSEWVPLGTWNITEPVRDSQNSITINAIDNTSKLDVSIPSEGAGFFTFNTRVKEIEELTGLEFAQTIEQLEALAGRTLRGNAAYGNALYPTCRAELCAMAQFLGCLAYIDRSGNIAFRKYGDNSTVPTIPAGKRFKADLAEYSIRVSAVSYTGRWGTTIKQDTAYTANTGLSIDLSDNTYLHQPSPDVEDGPEDSYSFSANLSRILDSLADVGVWVPGQIDYYGDPTLDLGDMVTLSGGINGETTSRFLVTGIVWQFRGPQTLISAGAGTEAYSSVGSSGSAGGSSGAGSTVVHTASWVMLDLDFYGYETIGQQLKELGELLIACAEPVVVVVQITAVLHGTTAAENELRILVDGVMQTVYSADTVAADERRTVSLSVPLSLSDGVHRITVEAKGNAAIERITGAVIGQQIAEYIGDPTTTADYRYHDDTVDEYIGESTMPKIPQQLGGNDVHIIGSGSFAESDIESVAIPDGAEEIK